VVRKVVLTYWHTAAFHTLYSGLSGWTPASGAPEVADRPIMDRWVLSELARTVVEADEAMNRFDAQRAANRLATFIDDLSNWYVRRSRRRFWDAEATALATLHECLDTLTRLLAPLVPFVTERVWQAVVAATDTTAPDSVHLAPWPASRAERIDLHLAEQMILARKVVELGRTTRTEAALKTRQPLARGLVAAAGWQDVPDQLRTEIAAELNVGTLDATSGAGEVVDHAVRPRFRVLGRRFGSRTQQVASAVRDAEPESMAAALCAKGTVELVIDGEPVTLTSDEIEVVQVPRTGWAVTSRDGITVALDTALTPELRRAGLARDAMRAIQHARKDSGLQVSDRISVWWRSEGDTAATIREHSRTIADEVLATTFTEGEGPPELPEQSDDSVGVMFRLRVTG